MNNKKTYFKVGRHYFPNDAETTYHILSDYYTRSGSRWVYMKDDKSGYESKYKVHLDKDGNEYIDTFSNTTKKVDLASDWVILSSNESSYIASTDNEIKLLNYEEAELSIEEIMNFLKKGVVPSNTKFIIKRA